MCAIIWILGDLLWKKSDLQKLIGRDFGGWEITSAGCDNVEEGVVLNLKALEWYERTNGPDYKKYSGKEMEITILDKYAFTYLKDGKLIEAIKANIERNKGIYWSNMQQLNEVVTAPAYYVTTSIQYNWNRFLREIEDFNEEEYVKIFKKEYRKHLIEFHTKQGNVVVLEKYVNFFNNLGKDLEKANSVD